MKLDKSENLPISIECIKCGGLIPTHKKKESQLMGLTLDCECGCIQRCLGVQPGMSRWRVLNPFHNGEITDIK